METKKGMYFDGHERPEVIQDRQERFLPAIDALKAQAVWVHEDHDGKISVVNTDKPYLPVSVDQKGHHSNERPGWYVAFTLWMFGGIWWCLSFAQLYDV